jgi:hypothetical protein
VTEEDEEATEPLDGEVAAQCPYCGEGVQLTVDPVGAGHEQYVEDCPVCCRPWSVSVSRGEDGLDVQLARDDD